MWNMIWPILLVVGANTLYNISAKSTPADVDPFASLTITYFVAMVSSLALYFLTAEHKTLLAECSKTNWSAAALGLAAVGLEFGFLCIYRAGWKVSTAHLVASLLLSCVLLLVGLLLYRETLTLRQLVGMGACSLGLFLIAR